MRHLALVITAALLPSAGWAQHRGLNLQATPRESPLLPLPPTPPRDGSNQPGPGYDLAPTPNRDVAGPQGPRASNAPQLAPGIFTRGEQYRGEGYSPGSTAQSEQERRAYPGAGFKLRMPLQQE